MSDDAAHEGVAKLKRTAAPSPKLLAERHFDVIDRGARREREREKRTDRQGREKRDAMGHGPNQTKPNQAVGHPWSCDGVPLRTTAAMLRGKDAWRCRAPRLIGPLCVSWHPFSAAAWRGRRRLGRGWGRFVVDRDWPRPRCHANAMHNALPAHLAAGHWQPQKPPGGHHPLRLFSGALFWVFEPLTAWEPVLLSHLASLPPASTYGCMPCSM